jgi:hypothetical protein
MLGAWSAKRRLSFCFLFLVEFLPVDLGYWLGSGESLAFCDSLLGLLSQ